MKRTFIYAATLCMAGALMFASCEDEKDPLDDGDKTTTEKPEPSGISGAKHDICSDTVRLTATAVTEATSYVWYNGSDSIAETTANTYDATAVGSYSVAAKNEGGLSAKSDAWEIVSGCVAAAGTIEQARQSSSVLLSVNTITGAATYNWYRADAENGTYVQVASIDTADGRINNAISYHAAEVGWYTVAGANSYGEGARATPVHVEVIPVPDPPAAPIWNAATTVSTFVDSAITLSVENPMVIDFNSKYIWYEVTHPLFSDIYTEIPSDSAAVITLTKSEAGEYKFAVKRLNTQTGLASEYSTTQTVIVSVPSTGGGESGPVSIDDFFTDGVTFRVYEKQGGFLGQSEVNYTVTVKKYGFMGPQYIRIAGLGLGTGGSIQDIDISAGSSTGDGLSVEFDLDATAQELTARESGEEPYYSRTAYAEYTGTTADVSNPYVYIVAPVAGTAQITKEVKAEVKKIDGKITIFIPSKKNATQQDVSYSYYGQGKDGNTVTYDFLFTGYGIDATDYDWPGQTGVIIREE
ncbi:MAG: hypothetical protein LBL94_04795 [Prevotellaceae bacterium]|jgi:hypothetical protein|nr:hypothetical protein [Prevotellaceae bacterium]